MRKLILVMIIGLNLLGLNLSFNTEVGYLPYSGFLMYESKYRASRVTISGSFYTKLESFVHMKRFYIGGSIKTHFWSYDDCFSPDESYYTFKTGINITDNIKIGFSHYCAHPVVPFIYTDAIPKWEGTYEEIFIKFSGSTEK